MAPSLEPITASWDGSQPLPAVWPVREWEALPPDFRHEISDRGRALSKREFWALMKLIMPEPEWGWREGYVRYEPYCWPRVLREGRDEDM